MSTCTFQVFKGSEQGRIIQSETHRILEEDEVLIKITHAGLCGTDLLFKTQDMVLGHEGIGIVQRVGTVVTRFKVGDRAGWGCLHDSCLQCHDCLTGNEMFCHERKAFGESNKDQGGFAPLMCAGTTVFNAMEMNGIRPTERVGILGIGGLGHLAIQFATKMGCEVVAFSGTPGKESEAKSLGAKEFFVTRCTDALKSVKPINHLFVTTSVAPDWGMFIPILAARATIYPVGLSFDNFTIPHVPALAKGLRVQWTLCSSRALHIKMLDFVAQHHIEPIVQEFPLTLEGVEEAIKKLESGKVRYRAVLIAESEA